MLGVVSGAKRRRNKEQKQKGSPMRKPEKEEKINRDSPKKTRNPPRKFQVTFAQRTKQLPAAAVPPHPTNGANKPSPCRLHYSRKSFTTAGIFFGINQLLHRATLKKTRWGVRHATAHYIKFPGRISKPQGGTHNRST